jgi:hypothetical protein
MAEVLLTTILSKWSSQHPRESFYAYSTVLENIEESVTIPIFNMDLRTFLSMLLDHLRRLNPQDSPKNVQNGLISTDLFITALLKRFKYGVSSEDILIQLMPLILELCLISFKLCSQMERDLVTMDTILSFHLPLCIKCMKWIQLRKITDEHIHMLLMLLQGLEQVNILGKFQDHWFIVLKNTLSLYRKLYSIQQWTYEIPYNLLLEPHRYNSLRHLCETCLSNELEPVDPVFIDQMQMYTRNSTRIPRYLWRELCLTFMILYDFSQSVKCDSTESHIFEALDSTIQTTTNLNDSLVIRLMMEHDAYLWEFLEVSLHLTYRVANQ